MSRSLKLSTVDDEREAAGLALYVSARLKLLCFLPLGQAIVSEVVSISCQGVLKISGAENF